MFRSGTLLASLALIPLLSACESSTGGGKVRSASLATTARPAIRAKPSAVRQPVVQPPPKPQVQMLPGLEGVIGSTASQLSRQFGTARLDVLEGDARKLQYGGNACVLDVYLYPSAPGREPQATYVDARRASDGQDVDRVSCISALRQP
jgi:hypothetical protein